MESGRSLDLVDGTVFAARYRIERRIAAGGMGAVYEVTHLETNRRRALKVMHANYVASDDLRAKFRQEARVTAEIESEHIVDVFDAGIDDATGMPFLVMELLRGRELSKLVKRRGPLPPKDVVRYLYETSLALDKTHRARIVHRDLKPDNLFLCERERGPARIKVLDFGIAKIVKEVQTHVQSTRSFGTPLYMAPEQFLLQSAVSGTTDIFALGMIAFTLLVGKPYWLKESKQAKEMLAFALHASRGPVESPVQRARELYDIALPPAFDPWFFRATAADPATRFPVASEAVLALAEVLGVPSPEPEKTEENLEDRVVDSVTVPKVGETEREQTTAVMPIPTTPTAPTASLVMKTAPTQMAMTQVKPPASQPAPSVPVPPSRIRSYVFIGAGATILLTCALIVIVKGPKLSGSPVDSSFAPETGVEAASPAVSPPIKQEQGQARPAPQIEPPLPEPMASIATPAPSFQGVPVPPLIAASALSRKPVPSARPAIKKPATKLFVDD